MFELVVMPLIDVWMDEGLEESEAKEALADLQSSLAEALDIPVEWEEQHDPTGYEEPYELEVYCMYGLRAAAAWIEHNESLEGFEVTDEPWMHPAFDAVEKEGRAHTFLQVLHADATFCVAYLPAALPDIYEMHSVDDDEDLPDSAEESESNFSVGSLTNLRKELDILRESLGIEPGVEAHIESLVFDPEEDPLAGPRFGWILLSKVVDEAIERGLPLLVFEPEGEEIDLEQLQELSADELD